MHSSSLEITDPSRSRSDLSSFITHLNPHLPEHYLPLVCLFLFSYQAVHHNFHLFTAMKRRRRTNPQKSPSTCLLSLCCFPHGKKYHLLIHLFTQLNPPKQQPASRASYHWSSSSIHTHFVLLFPRHESLVFSWFCLMLDNSANKKQPLLQQFVSPANPK